MFTLSTVNSSNEYQSETFIEKENDAIFRCISCHLNDLVLENCKARIYSVSRKLWKSKLAHSSYPSNPFKNIEQNT